MLIDNLFSNKFLIRDIEAEELVESFLVSAIASLLGYRFFLKITGYPMLGGENFHIAHVLLGGVFMLAAIIMLLVFISKPATRLAAVLGGIGFGLFIDELGKFITHDNNYFYQPTIAIIYLIFVLIYFFSQSINRFKRLTKREYLINAIEISKEAAYNDLEGHEKTKAFELLKKSEPKNPMVRSLKRMLSRIDSVPPEKPNLLSKTNRFFHKLYKMLISKKWFSGAIVTFFVAYTIGGLLKAISLISSKTSVLSVSEWGELVSSAAAGAFVDVGVLRIKSSRVDAYRMFKYAVLISIFLTQLFTFYKEQLYALVGLFWNILILITLRYMISEEVMHENGGLGIEKAKGRKG